MKFDFSARFQSAFGFVSATVSSRLDAQGYGDVVKESGLNVLTYANGEATFDEITLRNGSEEYKFAYRLLAEEYAGVFATPPMLSMKRAKKLVITSIDNSDIEVVERYGTEPYEIIMRGLLIDMVEHQFPIDKMETLNKIFEVNREWTIDSEILGKVDVQAVYLKDISFDFVEGYEDTIAYTITARAIRSIEVQLMS